jgi:hypothetical protein
MTERNRYSEKRWHKLEARMAQAKRAQVNNRVNRAIIWALIIGALLVVAIHLLVNYT